MGAVEAVVPLIHMFSVSSQFQAFLSSLKNLFQAFISLLNKPDSLPFLLPQIRLSLTSTIAKSFSY